MYETTKRSGKRMGRGNRRMVIQLDSPHMHRGRAGMVLGAVASVISTMHLLPRARRAAEHSVIDADANHAFSGLDAERREGSP